MSGVLGGARRQTDMTKGPLLGKIVAFALPMALAYVVQQLLSTADGMVLGALVGQQALAAVGDATPAVTLYLDLVVGLSVGANVEVAMRLGRRDERGAKRASCAAIPFSLVAGAAVGVVGALSAPALLRAMGTPEQVLPQAVSYLAIYCLGMPAVSLYNFAAAVLRASGDSTRPLAALVAACAVNAAGDVALGVWAGMGVAGVAMATVAAFSVAAVLCVLFLARGPVQTRPEPSRMRLHGAELARFCAVGVPAGVQGMVFALSNVVIQGAINGFGADAMAAGAASWNYECFAYFMVAAFGQACVTFTGQNYAAGEYGRCRRVFSLCLWLALGSSAALCLALAAFASPLVAAFGGGSSVVALGTVRMLMVGALEFLPALFEVPAGAMRGMGRSVLPMAVIMLGTCALRLAWVATGFRALGTYESLMAVYPLSWAVTGAAMLGVYFWLRRELLRGPGAGAARDDGSRRARRRLSPGLSPAGVR